MTTYVDKYPASSSLYTDKYLSTFEHIYFVTPDLKKILVGSLEDKYLVAKNSASDLYTNKYPTLS